MWRISWKAGLQNDGRTLRLEINNESLKYEKGEGGEVTKNETKRNEVREVEQYFQRILCIPNWTKSCHAAELVATQNKYLLIVNLILSADISIYPSEIAQHYM